MYEPPPEGDPGAAAVAFGAFIVGGLAAAGRDRPAEGTSSDGMDGWSACRLPHVGHTAVATGSSAWHHRHAAMAAA